MKNDWIIVVDDDALSLQNARNLLAENQIRVDTARSGRELLAFMEENSPDLILLDILMPEMDGFETYDRLREYEAKQGRRQTPVIFLSGENDSTAERRGLTMGASDYVRKPFNRDILLRRIRNTIQNSRTIESLTEEATIDRLTGLLNKAGTAAKVTKLCRSEAGMLAILDLDSFKLINDIYGHDMGDRVLSSFADILRQNTRAGDVLCRIGGDEFLAFCRNASGENAMAELTKRLNEQMTAACREMMGADFNVPIGVSVGAVRVPEQGREYELLFPLADKALYQAKQNGKHTCAVYCEDSRRTDGQEAEPLDRELARMAQIMGERGRADSALWLGQNDFTLAYRYILRALPVFGGTAVRLLIRLSSEADERFREITDGVLRSCDAVTQIGPARYFALLPGQTAQSAEPIMKRILAEWEKTDRRGRPTLEYVMDELRAGQESKTGSAALPKISGIDAAEGVKNCGSADSWLGLLKLFYGMIGSDASEIENYRQGGDLKNYTIKVHALKSAARTIGAKELSERAQAMEEAGNAGDSALIGEKTPELLALYRSYIERLKPLFESDEEDTRALVDAGTLANTYDAIAECAAMKDYDMTEAALDSLKAYRLPPGDEKRVEDIRNAMMELDWERVAALCKQ